MNKDQQIDTWRRFLAEPESMDIGDFPALFTEDWTDAELAAILAPFRGADEIARRIRRIRSHVPQRGPLVWAAATDDDLMAAARTVIETKRALCDRAGDAELVDLLDGIPIRWEAGQPAHDRILRGDTPNAWINETVGDLVHDHTPDRSPAAYALAEALYGSLFGNFDLQWYCLQPLTDLNAPDLSPLYEFWSRGGQLAIGPSEALVRRSA